MRSCLCRSHSGTLALKTGNFSKRNAVVLVKRKTDLLKPSSGQKTLEKNKEKSVLVNPFLRFTKTTDSFTKILGLQGRGS